MMVDYKEIVEFRSCNSGCNTSKWCMCALADDMADEINQLRETLHDLMACTPLFPETTKITAEMAENYRRARSKARSLLGDKENG